MWLITVDGAYSIVKNSYCASHEVVVRSRVKADLERFLKHTDQPRRNREKIQAFAGSDYPYRIQLHQSLVAEVIYEMARDIDYPNFKDAVPKNRKWVYSRVWSALIALETLASGVKKARKKRQGKMAATDEELALLGVDTTPLYDEPQSEAYQPLIAPDPAPEDYASADWIGPPLED